ncbi:hypothetical protein [Nonomuraea dietziae]|uniref:hypothetical protein n=1 Tax=Nonomuraea dietziae TaxID=65515 RepID=UPI00341A83C2
MALRRAGDLAASGSSRTSLRSCGTGTPEEAASAALFVMANAYVTGTVLTVDGGASLA